MIIRRASVTALDFDGLQILDYTANLEGDSSLAHIQVPPGARHALSWSTRSTKYYYLLSGTLRFWLDQEQTVLQTGDLCIVPKGQRFRYQNRSDAPVELLLVHTPGFQLEAEVFED
jgi:mannose-6-phosphate isomerase-like protein (cupin superfamily)